MAYLDEMAMEREKSRQAMLAGKTPLLGADTSAALHALGVNLGVVPPGTPPSKTAELIQGLFKGPGRVKVDEGKPLQVQPLVGRTTASLQPSAQDDSGVGGALSKIMDGAKDSALQQMLRNQQKQQQPVQPAGAPTTPGAPAPNANIRAAGYRGRVPHSPEGPTYQADLKYLNDRGGHFSVMKDGKITHVPVGTEGQYGKLDPELAARLRTAGEAFEKENPGKQAKFGEFSRGADVQAVYWKESDGGRKYAAASPGNSRHQHGAAGDLPDSDFRKWLNAGNQDKHGLHFPVKGDAPHVEVNPAHKQSYSNPSGTLPTSAAPAGTPGPGAAATGGHPVLAEQRAQYKAQADANPALRERMAAIMISESSTPAGQQGTAEAMLNRVHAAGRPFTDAMDPAYHADYMVRNQAKYQDALNRVRSDPQLRSQLYSLQDKAFGGSNVTNLATDYSSKATAAKSATNSTETFASPDGQRFFRKDINPQDHGAGTVSAVQAWKAKTEAAMKPGAQKPPTSAPPAPSTAPAQAAPRPAPQAAPAAPTAPAQSAPQASAQPAPQAAPQATPAPAAQPPSAAPAAAAPAQSPAGVPAPSQAAKPAPPAVNPAHRFLDMKTTAFADHLQPGASSQVPGMVKDMTVREVLNHPIYGGMAKSKMGQGLDRAGVTQQQLNDALKEGPPKSSTAGKRSEAPAVPEQMQKVRYAQADTGTMTDAGPELPDDPTTPTLDPLQQKPVQNEDGSISTVRTIGVEENGKEVNIPTVPPEGGRVMSNDEAVQRYQDTGKHLGKFDNAEQAGAAAERLHQEEASRISQHPQGEQPAVNPEFVKALTDAYKDESRVPQAPAPPDAMPVLPVQPDMPLQNPQNGNGAGLSLAPSGLSSIPTGAIPGAAPSQGGSIAMAGMLPPIQNATFSTPLLDQTAASGSTMGLSPIPYQTLGSWGWGGGGGGGGFDFGGGGGGFSMPMFGGFSGD